MNKIFLLLTLAGLCAMAQKTVLDISFTPDQMKDVKLPDFAKIDVIDGNPCLAVTSTDKGKMNVVEIPFDYSKYSDYSVAITVRVKYSDVTQPKDSWNGTKIQATYLLDSGRQWKNPGGSEFGTADWHQRETSFIADKGIKKEGASIQLGLQDCTGTVWFDDLKVSVVSYDEIFPKLTPADYKCVYTDRVKMEHLYRGVMSPGSFNPQTTIQRGIQITCFALPSAFSAFIKPLISSNSASLMTWIVLSTTLSTQSTIAVTAPVTLSTSNCSPLPIL